MIGAATRGPGKPPLPSRSEIASSDNGPFPRLRSLHCFAQRNLPSLARIFRDALLRKDGVGNLEVTMHYTAIAGSIASTR